MQIKLSYVLAVIILGWSLASCFENEEGCLDSLSNNYSPGADKACDSCCTYPSLKLTVSHVFDTLNLSFGETYLDDFGNPFQVQELKYFISDVNLQSADTIKYYPTDSVEISTLVDDAFQTIKVNENYELIKQLSTSATLGEFTQPGNFTQVNFNIGLSSAFNHIDTSTLEETNLFRADSDSLYLDITSGYIFQRLRLIRDTSTMESVVFEIWGDENIQAIELATELSRSKGVDLTIPLSLDLKIWLRGVNVREDSEAAVISRLKQNIISSFSIN